jgi:hypothetical protein
VTQRSREQAPTQPRKLLTSRRRRTSPKKQTGPRVDPTRLPPMFWPASTAPRDDGPAIDSGRLGWVSGLTR